MTLNVVAEGEVALLEHMLNKVAPTDVVLRLYANNYTISDGSVYADFTAPTDGGYAPATLAGAGWTITNVGGVGTGSYAEQTFTFAGAETCYGYYATKGTSTVLWAEAFSSPFVLPGGGGTIGVTPKIEAS